MAPDSTLSDDDRALIDAPNFGYASTLRADGTILTAPVWVDRDGDELVLNSEDKRAWPANLRERQTITLTVPDKENPYEYVSIGGHLVSETTDGAFDHADRLAQEYMGVEKYPLHQDGDVRVLFRIAVDRVQHVTRR